MEQNRLHPFKMGKSWKFDQSDVDSYIQALRDEASKSTGDTKTDESSAEESPTRDAA
jgi:hypothetical protein